MGGLSIKTLRPGDGLSFPRRGDTITFHYVGTLLDGTKFDSSVDRGQPFIARIGVGSVIRAWDEGVTRLSLGEKAIITASAEYCYGDRGFGRLIPPGATLNFEVELLQIN